MNSLSSYECNGNSENRSLAFRDTPKGHLTVLIVLYSLEGCKTRIVCIGLDRVNGRVTIQDEVMDSKYTGRSEHQQLRTWHCHSCVSNV